MPSAELVECYICIRNAYIFHLKTVVPYYCEIHFQGEADLIKDAPKQKVKVV